MALICELSTTRKRIHAKKKNAPSSYAGMHAFRGYGVEETEKKRERRELKEGSRVEEEEEGEILTPTDGQH